jgi:hypothetical protein
MLQELFIRPEPSEALHESWSPLHGLQLKLELIADGKSRCCANFAVVYAGKGPHTAELRCDGKSRCCANFAVVYAGKGPNTAELRCANCGSHRGWLPKEAASWLLTALTHFPEARADVHVIRNI